MDGGLRANAGNLLARPFNLSRNRPSNQTTICTPWPLHSSSVLRGRRVEGI